MQSLRFVFEKKQFFYYNYKKIRCIECYEGCEECLEEKICLNCKEGYFTCDTKGNIIPGTFSLLLVDIKKADKNFAEYCEGKTLSSDEKEAYEFIFGNIT